MPQFTIPCTYTTLRTHSGDMRITYGSQVDRVELLSLTGLKVGEIPPSFLHCMGFEQLLETITNAIAAHSADVSNEAHALQLIEGGLS